MVILESVWKDIVSKEMKCPVSLTICRGSGMTDPSLVFFLFFLVGVYVCIFFRTKLPLFLINSPYRPDAKIQARFFSLQSFVFLMVSLCFDVSGLLWCRS